MVGEFNKFIINISVNVCVPFFLSFFSPARCLVDARTRQDCTRVLMISNITAEECVRRLNWRKSSQTFRG